ncbi:unnamed protein product [Lampetra fluviatilis]
MSQEENKMDGVDNNTAAPKESPVEQSAGGEECLKVRFAVLSGEHVQHVQRAADSVLTLTNYRLHIVRGRHSTNIPLRLIDSVESRDMFQLQITCKDGRVYMCSLQTFEECQSLCKRLSNMALLPPGLDGLFAFAHHATCQDGGSGDGQATLCQPGEHIVERFQNEVERMGYDLENAWRTSEVNTSYRLCASYPQQLLVPAWITDKELERVASFRSGKRIPVVVYRHQHNGAVIARSSQPEVSWWGWRSPEDEHLIQSMARACALNKWEPGGGGTGSNGYGAEFSSLQNGMLFSLPKTETSQVPAAQSLLIMDARSYPAAVANRAKGGGCECPEYYPNCEITFMSMANIHYIRKSFQSLRTLCSQPPDPNSWLSALENTRWLQHLSLLLKAGCAVAGAVAGEGRPVLVHCSDGWDRTPQIVALAKLLLDPYYRTIQGFQVLVEMEWLDFGHKFADRCGHGDGSEDASERCPVFLQWLDCVHQLQRQFPCSFEFNEAFLVKLVQHTYSCLYGTFLCNSTRERAERSIANRCCSVWLLLRPANKAFTNLLYTPGSDTVLRPVYHVRSLLLWSGVYLPEPFSAGPPPRDLPPAPPPTFPLPNPKAEEGPHPRLSKTRSFEDLPSATEGVAQAGGPGGGRRLSDPSLQGLGLRIDRRGSMEIISCVSDTPTEDGLLAQSETFTCAPSRDSGLEASDPDCAPICSGHEVDHHRRERTAASDMHDHKPLVNKVGFELDVVAKADSSLGNTTVNYRKEKNHSGMSNGHCENVNGNSDSVSAENSPVQPSASQAVEQGMVQERKSVMESSTETITDEPRRCRAGKQCTNCSLTETQGLEQRSGLTQCSNRQNQGYADSGWPLTNGDAEQEKCTASIDMKNTNCESTIPINSGHHQCTHHKIGSRCVSVNRDEEGEGDPDGLPCAPDPVQRRLLQMDAQHRRETLLLRRALQELRAQLSGRQRQQHLQAERPKLDMSGGPNRRQPECPEELSTISDLDSEVESGPLSQCSTGMVSETSWEHIDTQDGHQMAKLVPSQCYSCEGPVWLQSTEHYCRSCGKVFCASCCDGRMSPPSKKPLDVCGTCRDGVRKDGARVNEFETPQTAASSS